MAPATCCARRDDYFPSSNAFLLTADTWTQDGDDRACDALVPETWTLHA